MDREKEVRKPTTKRKKANVNRQYCVACGVCASHCPRQAISIISGMYALVDEDKCVGCTKCVKFCPASDISMIEVEVKEKNVYEEK